MKKLILILVSLILVGCAPGKTYLIQVENFYGEEAKYSYDYLDKSLSPFQHKSSVYQMRVYDEGSVEKFKNQLMSECIKDWSYSGMLGFNNLSDGCVSSPVLTDRDLSENQLKKRDEFRAALKKEKDKFESNKAAKEKQIAEKNRQDKIAQLDVRYSVQCKKFKQGSSEYEKCLFESEKLAIQEQNKLANLPPTERYAYTCEKTYGFKKGSDNFKECVFKIMTTEYQMQAKLNETRIKELEARIAGMERSASANASYNNQMLEIERMKAKAMQDQVNFAKNKDITDTLLGMSQSLLSPNRPSAPSSNNFMLNCQTRKFGGFDQIQCF